MAGFLTTSGTSFQIERIMIDAKQELVLISPYLKLSKTFFERLQDASKKGVLVKIIYGKDELKSSEEKQIKSLENIELYFFDNLHAKCYYNETEMVITSMNMYEFSEKNNREMGIHINQRTDRKAFMDAVSEAQSILNNSTCRFKSANIRVDVNKAIVQFDKKNKSIDKSFVSNSNIGMCIRCGNDIILNPFQPLCDKCFKSWSYFGNVDFVEKVCHKCGKPIEPTFAKPLCFECFKELPQDVKNKLGNPRF